jgi:UDP-N-acetylglucosamine--N-acetylmuramyl-(pentapeptide) pyrophosphoryl-undecaprenol N-acetylglucosamine transferase
VVETNIKNYRQYEFVNDMGTLYACADVVVSRAGAGAIFEILALKKPSLLIPLVGQTRGDQAENAAYFQSKGLCRVLNQSRLHLLADEIEQTVLDDGLKTRLQNSSFTSGNRKILQALLQEL